ncbi:MAG TPA: VOC family protein [Gemmatimonadales bacterium]|nr:VOC family protein [Gemmatimonadales bacterium]
MARVHGIHHVTAIASDPQRNVDFYAGFLGLRLVKRTVNFDDPQTYHFYFGDATGHPGTLLTFFPWPHARRGRHGTGQVAVTSFAVLPHAIGFWLERLVARGITYQGPTKRGTGASAETVITFADPDGLLLEIVGTPQAEARPGWDAGPGIQVEQSIRGMHAVTLWADDSASTERVLVDTLGFRPVDEEGTIKRFAAGDGASGTLVNLRAVGDWGVGVSGAGTVHHVAWRVPDDVAQLAARDGVIAAGLHPTPVIDRNYFHSVYFREPGGVLFELATDPPGFAIDESPEHLGERLMLPPQYEPHREAIELVLPPIHLPTTPDGSAFARDMLEFTHRYVAPSTNGDGAEHTTLLLLHGTGGDENDLLPLGRALLPDAGLLGVRGKVMEHGAPRFFRRLREGVFDQEDLTHRTEELAAFLDAAAERYGLARDAIVAVGFSNGANIAASLLLRHGRALRAAVLLSPMLPYDPDGIPDLSGLPVFIGAGRTDEIAPAEQVERLAALLRKAGADVTVHWEAGGHAVSAEEIEAATRWVAALPHAT